MVEEVNGLEGTEAGTVKDRQARRKVMQEIGALALSSLSLPAVVVALTPAMPVLCSAQTTSSPS